MQYDRTSLARPWSAAATLFAVIAGFLSAPPLPGANEERPPNFVLIFCDDLGYGDPGCFGSKKHRTPNIDRMAAEGTRFTSFYSTSGVCTPSRASLLTGCYPRRVNMHQSAKGEWVLFPVARRGLHPDETTVAEVLKSRGYATACIGKWHLGDQPEFLPTRQGFDTYFGIPYSNDMGVRQRPRKNPPLPLMRNATVIEAPADQTTLTRRYTEEAVRFIRENKDRPFFLYLPHTFPHWPLHASDRFRGRSANGRYGDAVEEIDWSTGEILATLNGLGLEGRTLVAFTSDNGAAKRHGGSNGLLRGFKGSTFEGGMRVPCVVRWPGTIPAGKTCDEVTSTMDVLPTFARLAGIDAPLAPERVIDGVDITALLRGESGARPSREALYYFFRGDLQAVRSGRWKLHLPRTRKPRGNEKGPQEVPAALFDLQSDIAEATDLSREKADVVKRLLALAESGREALGDGKRPGKGQRPAGLVENPTPRTLPTTAGTDWPQYRCDAGRTGYTSAELPRELGLAWRRELKDPPAPAWPRSNRMTFDRAVQPVVAGGRLFFGSSVDCKVYALDAATGGDIWARFTDGPVRFAPAVLGDRLYVASDDGYLYCLSSSDGELLWSKRGGPDASKILGNGRMISRWPVRGGPVIFEGVLYFASGIWPSDGIYLYAVDPLSGRVVWSDDKSGSIYMGQPHGGANAASGVAAQGYLAAASKQLFVPTGRAVPAAFDRAAGKLQYFHLQKYGQRGGSEVMAQGLGFFNNGVPYLASTGELAKGFRGGGLAATPEAIIRHSGKEVTAYRWKEKETADRKGKLRKELVLEPAWSFPAGAPSATVSEALVAGKTLVVGQEGRVVAFDLEARRRLWSLEVDGTPRGLAAAGGRLYASTDRGGLYCFAAGTPLAGGAPAERSAPGFGHLSYGSSGSGELWAAAAEEILDRTGIRDGYCLDLGCGDGALAREIAVRSRLRVCAVDPDPKNVARARRMLDAAGLYGTRVTVHCAPLEGTDYPWGFANLIVSGRSVVEGAGAVPREELARLMRPYGGVACLDRPGSMAVTERGPLPGAGCWTHQYSDPANTVCSNDVLVKGRLEALWFRDVGQTVPQRHGRGPAPLFSGGRIFSEGLDSLIAVDAYNGHLMWEFPLANVLRAYDGDHLMGTSGSGSNYCVAGDSVYVRREDRCLRIDAAKGELLASFRAPKGPDGRPSIWGFIACEGGILYGSLGNPEHVVTFRFQKGGDLAKQLTESLGLFAMDARSGDLKWHFAARHSIRHNAIAIGGDRVYLIDRPLALFDRRRDAAAGQHPAGELVCLDARTGEEVWKSRDNIYGTLLALSVKHGALLMSYQPTRFKLASELGGRLTALRARDGERLWEKTGVEYTTRPLINGRTIYAEGGAWDLLSGEERPFPFKRSYGCGQLAGSASMLVYRSATLGYFDLEENRENRDFGGVRPGCWINAIPVGGMVLVPDATAGCVCSYLNQAWLALLPAALRDERR